MYQTIASASTYSYEEKRSEFIAYLYPINSREAALQHLEQLKIEYPDARHHCWAYIVGSANQPTTVAFNDDGEPSGTAGKPMLHVLTQRGAGDCCAVVVRYFGGIKLGAGGLVRAYGQAVSKALDEAEWVTVMPQVIATVICSYEDEPHIRHFVDEHKGQVLNSDYSTAVSLQIQANQKEVAELRNSIQQRSAGRAVFTINEE